MTLEKLAHGFVETLTRLLNSTVTDGIRIVYKGSEGGEVGAVGYRLTRYDLVGQPIPITLGKAPNCWLMLNQDVTLDEDEGRYLKTVRARMALHSDLDGRRSLFRYDFDREAENPYPPAHLQVPAKSKALKVLRNSLQDLPKSFEDLHLPVGSHRFRPCLEDIIEFIVVEGLAEPRKGWRNSLRASRSDFHKLQLRAAVREDPSTAIAQLSDMGFEVKEA